MSTSITKGPAFEIRFCEGNKVQVYDLSRRGDQSANQLLPNEYLEDDVVNGRLRYSKLGNQWLSDDTGTKQHHQRQLAAIPDDPSTSTTTTTALVDEKNNNLDVIPVLAKRKALEDAKELESIRQGEEAMRKAMERKMKIEMARRARQKAAAEAESSINLENLSHKDDAPQDGSGDKNDFNNNTNRPMNEQDPQHQYEQEKDISFRTEENGRTTKTNQPSLLHNDVTPPTTPLPNRQQVDGDSISSDMPDTTSANNHENNKQHFDRSPSPPPLFTAAPAIERPESVYRAQSSPNQHYYPQHHDPQRQQQQQHVYNSYQPTPQIHQQQAAEDSFFHQDSTNDKAKPSSGCCCIIS
ncbi:hypothetical protein BCR42DRAFT_207574 [Absidia repens]|uniref:Uncharacterized protein n=1 Tax=Absidia repens TaxID=90262 RepID=A0A1X2IRR0_9FUNG|nr:hypothetical protein BCR42DRAFT_207574 [Absidia repens]